MTDRNTIASLIGHALLRGDYPEVLVLLRQAQDLAESPEDLHDMRQVHGDFSSLVHTSGGFRPPGTSPQRA